MPRRQAIDKLRTVKVCIKCKLEKPLSLFSVRSDCRDGYRNRCLDCTSIYMSDRWRNNPEHRTKQQRRSAQLYKSIEGRALALIRAARKRRPDGFTVTLDHVIAGLQRGVCPMTGIGFDFTNGHQIASGRFRNPYSPSLDRIDSRFGYTNENTRIVITQFNIMKGELSDSELTYICALIAERASG